MAQPDNISQCDITESQDSLSLFQRICASVDWQRQIFASRTRMALVSLWVWMASPVIADTNPDLVHQAVLTQPWDLVTWYGNALRWDAPDLTEEQQAQLEAFEQRLTGFYTELIAVTESWDDVLLDTGIQTRRATTEFLALAPMTQSAVIDTFYSNGGNVSAAIMEHVPHLWESRARVDKEVGQAFFDLMPRLLRNFEWVPDVMDRSQIDTSVTAEEYTRRLGHIHENSGMYLAHITYLLDRDPNFEYPRLTEEQYYAFVDAIMSQDWYDWIDRRFFPAFNQIMTEQAWDISSRAGDYIEANLGLEEAARIYSDQAVVDSDQAVVDSEQLLIALRQASQAADLAIREVN